MLSIIGYGAHARDIEAVLHRNGIHGVSVYDENPATGKRPPPKSLNGRYIIGVNSPATRRKMAFRFVHLKPADPIVDPTAILGPDIVMGLGTVVNPMVSMLHGVTLGSHVHVNTGVQMVRTTVGDYSTISPGVVICGDVEIGEQTWVGAGATICDRVQIGNNVIIGAGSVVLPESIIPDGTTVVGIYK